MGTVLLWNFAHRKFFSGSGIPLGLGNNEPQKPLIGPGRVSEWLIKGRMPVAGKLQALVERHYGAFYRLKPEKTLKIGGKTFTITGVVDIQKGRQIASANFYLDINETRRLIKMESGRINQLFLRV